MLKHTNTEEDWLRIIRHWSPDFEITSRGDNGIVVATMTLWALGHVTYYYPSSSEPFAFVLKFCEGAALDMCRIIENERR